MHSNSVARLYFCVTALWWMLFYTVFNALPSSASSHDVSLMEVTFCVHHGMHVTGLNCWLVCVDMHMLTAVESLEARVISRFPFMPNTAGTRMKISVISWNTSQFCRENTKCKIQLHIEGETQSRPQTHNESSTFSRWWSLEVNTPTLKFKLVLVGLFYNSHVSPLTLSLSRAPSHTDKMPVFLSQSPLHQNGRNFSTSIPLFLSCL